MPRRHVVDLVYGFDLSWLLDRDHRVGLRLEKTPKRDGRTEMVKQYCMQTCDKKLNDSVQEHKSARRRINKLKILHNNNTE